MTANIIIAFLSVVVLAGVTYLVNRRVGSDQRQRVIKEVQEFTASKYKGGKFEPRDPPKKR